MRNKLFQLSQEDNSDSNLTTTDLIPLAKDENVVTRRQERPERLEPTPKDEDLDDLSEDIGDSLESFCDMLALYDHVSLEGYSGFNKEVYTFYKNEINKALANEVISFEGYDSDVINSTVKNFQISTETIIGAIRTIGMLIYKLVAGVLGFIGTIWKKIFSGAEKVEQRANETLQAIEELQKKIQNGEVSVSEGMRQITELSRGATQTEETSSFGDSDYSQDDQSSEGEGEFPAKKPLPEDFPNKDVYQGNNQHGAGGRSVVYTGQTLFAEGFFPTNELFIKKLVENMTSQGYKSIFQNIILGAVTTAGGEGNQGPKKAQDVYEISKELLRCTKKLDFFKSKQSADYLAQLNQYFTDITSKYNHSKQEEEHKYISFNRQKRNNANNTNLKDGHDIMSSNPSSSNQSDHKEMSPSTSSTVATMINKQRDNNEGRHHHNPHTNADVWFCVQLMNFIKHLDLTRVAFLNNDTQKNNPFRYLSPPDRPTMTINGRTGIGAEDYVYFLSNYILGVGRIALVMKGSLFNIIEPIATNPDHYLRILAGGNSDSNKLSELRNRNSATEGDVVYDSAARGSSGGTIDDLVARNQAAFGPLIRVINRAYSDEANHNSNNQNGIDTKIALHMVVTDADFNRSGAYNVLSDLTGIDVNEYRRRVQSQYEKVQKGWGFVPLSVLMTRICAEVTVGEAWFARNIADRVIRKLATVGVASGWLRSTAQSLVNAYNARKDRALDRAVEQEAQQTWLPQNEVAGTPNEGGDEIKLRKRLLAMYLTLAKMNEHVDIPRAVETVKNINAVGAAVLSFNDTVNEIRKKLKQLGDNIKRFSDSFGGRSSSSGAVVQFGRKVARRARGRNSNGRVNMVNDYSQQNNTDYGHNTRLTYDEINMNTTTPAGALEGFNTLGYMLRRLKVLIGILIKFYGSIQVNITKCVLTSSNALARAIHSVIGFYNDTFSNVNYNRQEQDYLNQQLLNEAGAGNIKTYSYNENGPQGSNPYVLQQQSQAPFTTSGSGGTHTPSNND